MSATQDDIRRILLALREVRERVDAIEAAVAGIAEHGGVASCAARESDVCPEALDRV